LQLSTLIHFPVEDLK